MTSFLRPLAYRHRWIYDSVTAVSSLSVGGVARLRGLGLEALSHRLKPNAEILDLCCGSGEAAAPGSMLAMPLLGSMYHRERST